MPGVFAIVAAEYGNDVHELVARQEKTFAPTHSQPSGALSKKISAWINFKICLL
jgi:hypothetical protein